MITDLILNLLYGIVEFFWNLVPDWTIAVPAGTHGLAAWFSRFDGVAPFSEVMQITGLVGGLIAALVGFKLVKMIVDWVTALIP
jgi:hypothetical protein